MDSPIAVHGVKANARQHTSALLDSCYNIEDIIAQKKTPHKVRGLKRRQRMLRGTSFPVVSRFSFAH